MKFWGSLLLIAPLVLLCFAATEARADTYVLDIDHCTGGCGTTPFGTITITDIAGGVHMNVTLNNSAEFVLTGQQGSTIGFNLINSPTISIANVKLNNVATTAWSLDNGGVASLLHFDGFGTFQYSLNCCSGVLGGGAAEVGPLDLDILGTGLTSASFVKLSTGGSPNVYFAVDELSAQTGNTGPVGTSNVNVPEPASLVTLGIAALGTGIVRKRKLAPK